MRPGRRGMPFTTGEVVCDRTILEVLDLNKGLVATRYRVRYQACGHEGVIQHSTLRTAFTRGYVDSRCRECSLILANKNRAKNPTRTPVTIPDEHPTDWAHKLLNPGQAKGEPNGG